MFRYLPRIVDGTLAEALRSSTTIIVEGARATGKTTTAKQHARSELMLPRDLELLRTDPERVLSGLDAPALIDEWQLGRVDLLWTIKTMVDQNPSTGRYVLTGSVEPESYGPTYPLTGRGRRITMRPFTVRESLGLGDARLWIDRLVSGELGHPTRAHSGFELADMVSGFPMVWAVSRPEAELLAYAATVSERAVEERRDPVRARRVLNVLAELEAQVPDGETIWRSADVDRRTLQAHLDVFERAHILVPAPAWESNRLKRLTKRPKRLFADTALAMALADCSGAVLESDPQRAGHYFESFVAQQLRPEADRVGGGLYHLRTSNGAQPKEIDLIVEWGSGLVAIETKSRTRVRREDARHLEWFRSKLGDRVSAAAVVYRGTDRYELAPGVLAVPVSSFWELDDAQQ